MSEFEVLLDQLIIEITDIEAVEINDIPNIDLYMDQITTFMEDRLYCFKRNPDDKVLTKTMINNYAKAKVFPPPVKKKYTKNHMMLLIIIYHLKSVLSINDITRMLTPINEELKVSEKSEILEIVYTGFVILQKNNTKNVLSEYTGKYQLIEANIKEMGSTNTNEIRMILAVLLLSIQSNTEKRLAEKILDKYF